MIKKSERKKFLSNPLNAYIFIRMLTADLNFKMPKISSHKNEADGENIFECKRTLTFSFCSIVGMKIYIFKKIMNYDSLLS